MGEFIDITLTLSPDTPCWPGGERINIGRIRDIASGDVCNDGTLTCSLHAGTHVDAPLHYIADGTDAAGMSLDVLVGPAYVAALPGVESITEADLEALPLPADARRLLLRTRNSDLRLCERGDFRRDYVALTAPAARWLVARGVQLIGVDYLSVQRFHDGPETHLALLQAGIVVVEGLNLAQVEAGMYELICLPLKLAGADGAPARTLLRRMTT